MLHKSSTFIEACFDFFNEIIEYDITNEEPARFKKNYYLNYRQNMFSIILYNNK